MSAVFILKKHRGDSEADFVQFRPFTPSTDENGESYASMVYIHGGDAKSAYLTVTDAGLTYTIEGRVENFLSKENARKAWNALVRNGWIRGDDIERNWQVISPSKVRVL